MKRFLPFLTLVCISISSLNFIVPVTLAAPTFGSQWDSQDIIYCNDPAKCNLDEGTKIVSNNINDIEKNKRFSDYVQDIMTYALSFVAIIGVLLILFAGFQILTAGGDEKKVGAAKTMIMYAAIGMIVMFLAWSITKFVINIFDKSSSNPSGYHWVSPVDTANAYGDYDTNSFDEYKQKIEDLTSQLEREYKLSGRLSDTTLSTLQRYASLGADTFAQNDDYNYNNSIAKNLLISIDYVRKNPGSDNAITELAKNLNDFLNKTKIGRITGKITVTPQTGNAPLAVTFRAENVIDPSGVTVPKTNFIWSIRGTNNSRTIIGTGPSVMYKFQDERNYTVNLDIVSASRNSKGKIDTLPFTGKTIINVLPRAGTIYLYINGVKTTNLDRLKITPAIGRAGVLIDASSSVSANGSQFTRTSWDFGNGMTKTYDGAPKVERQIFANEGTYTIKLKLLTNENKEVTKDLQLDVVNPIASILAEKLSGFSNEDMKFQASTFFAVGQLRYEWNITDLAADRVVYTQSTQNINFKFPRSGKYAVKLKTNDAAGREDIDTVIVTIESRNPVAQFTTRVPNQELPNTFILDATTSYDPDSMDAARLSFDWTIDGQRIELENPSRNGALGKYTFNTLGTHTITLDVTNDDGKVASNKQSVSVSSLLAVKLRFSPRIVKVGAPVTLVAEAQDAKVYEWNFGDGSNDTMSVGRAAHIYKKSGSYDVSLTVRGTESQSNTITRRVYVTDADSPFALISLKADNNDLNTTEDACNGQEAYVLDRSELVTFSAADSVNVDGTNAGLAYTWKYSNKNSNQQTFTYKFDELGCFPVDLTVRSQKNGKLSSMRTYVRVDNLLPKISGLSVSVANQTTDPVIVKVAANNAKDEDGVIVSYLWYYYTDTDPEPQDFRLTRVPNTTFVLPKISGKYFFAVTVEDSNGAKVNSDEVSEERYSLTLAGDNINTPILSLKTSDTAIFVGDSTSFNVTSKNILGTDISAKCEYKWDYDGDGFYDETTTEPKATHIYTKPGTFNFKVKATYKGMSNTKYQQIVVRNQLKPQFEYVAIGSKLILINTTKGFYTQSTWDLGNGVTSTNLDSFTYDFTDGTFPSSVSLTVSDGDKVTQTVNLPVKKDIVNKLRLEKKTSKLVYFTIPKAEDDTIHIESPDQKLAIYLGESKDNVKKYMIDTNVDIDTDLDGVKDNDFDNIGTDSERKGLPFIVKNWDEKVGQRTMKLATYGENNALIESMNLKVILDFANESLSGSGSTDISKSENISAEDRVALEEIKNEITNLPASVRPKMMDYLAQLQDAWGDEREKTKIIIDFEAYIEQNLGSDKVLKEKLYSLLEGLLVSQDNNKSKAEIAAQVLKNLAKPSKSYDVISKKMDEILSHPNDLVKNKTLGQDILKIIENDGDIPAEDKILIKSQLQEIIYAGAPKSETPAAQESTSSSGVLDFIIGIAKILGYIFAGFLGLLVLLFIYYKLSNKNENLGFQDFIIEKFFGGEGSGGEHEARTPTAPTPQPTISAAPQAPVEKKDVFASLPTEAPAVETQPQTVEAVTPEITTEAAPVVETVAETQESDIPDWLKNSSFVAPATESAPAETPVVEASVEPTAPAADIPDWLKGGEAFATPTPEPKKDDIPDWLKGMNQEELATEIEEELAVPAAEAAVPAEAPLEMPVTPVVETPAVESDIPEWLRGSMSEETPTSEEASDATFRFDTEGTAETDVTSDVMAAETPFEIEEVGEEPKRRPKKPAKKPTQKPVKKPDEKAKLTPNVPPAPDAGDLPEWLK